jgi:hypothetical protein
MGKNGCTVKAQSFLFAGSKYSPHPSGSGIAQARIGGEKKWHITESIIIGITAAIPLGLPGGS